MATPALGPEVVDERRRICAGRSGGRAPHRRHGVGGEGGEALAGEDGDGCGEGGGDKGDGGDGDGGDDGDGGVGAGVGGGGASTGPSTYTLSAGRSRSSRCPSTRAQSGSPQRMRMNLTPSSCGIPSTSVTSGGGMSRSQRSRTLRMRGSPCRSNAVWSRMIDVTNGNCVPRSTSRTSPPTTWRSRTPRLGSSSPGRNWTSTSLTASRSVNRCKTSVVRLPPSHLTERWSVDHRCPQNIVDGSPWYSHRSAGPSHGARDGSHAATKPATSATTRRSRKPMAAINGRRGRLVPGADDAPRPRTPTASARSRSRGATRPAHLRAVRYLMQQA